MWPRELMPDYELTRAGSRRGRRQSEGASQQPARTTPCVNHLLTSRAFEHRHLPIDRPCRRAVDRVGGGRIVGTIATPLGVVPYQVSCQYGYRLTSSQTSGTEVMRLLFSEQPPRARRRVLAEFRRLRTSSAARVKQGWRSGVRRITMSRGAAVAVVPSPRARCADAVGRSSWSCRADAPALTQHGLQPDPPGRVFAAPSAVVHVPPAAARVDSGRATASRRRGQPSAVSPSQPPRKDIRAGPAAKQPSQDLAARKNGAGRNGLSCSGLRGVAGADVGAMPTKVADALRSSGSFLLDAVSS